MASDVREALEAASSLFYDLVDGDQPPARLIDTVRQQVAAAIEKAPAWHDRPNQPGRWVVYSFERHMVISFSASQLAAGLPFFEGRFYGPIPEDKHDE